MSVDERQRAGAEACRQHAVSRRRRNWRPFSEYRGYLRRLAVRPAIFACYGTCRLAPVLGYAVSCYDGLPPLAKNEDRQGYPKENAALRHEEGSQRISPAKQAVLLRQDCVIVRQVAQQREQTIGVAEVGEK